MLSFFSKRESRISAQLVKQGDAILSNRSNKMLKTGCKEKGKWLQTKLPTQKSPYPKQPPITKRAGYLSHAGDHFTADPKRKSFLFDLQARATSEIAVADLSDSENR